jgi:hypothetical protein
MPKVARRRESIPLAVGVLAREQEGEGRDRGGEACRTQCSEYEGLRGIRGDGDGERCALLWLDEDETPTLERDARRLGRERCRGLRVDLEQRVGIDRRQKPQCLLAQLGADEHELG